LPTGIAASPGKDSFTALWSNVAMLPATPPTTSVDIVRACVEQVSQTLAIARSLVRAGKHVDLTGLDAEIGFVCARALDLPPEDGRAARPILLVLRSELEALAEAIEQSGPRCAGGSFPCPAEQGAAS
jgi:hypothetical protein